MTGTPADQTTVRPASLRIDRRRAPDHLAALNPVVRFDQSSSESGAA
jgi:hypothetical protein